ncbi:uncharacterized protein ATNIH1004_003912 [Aspergillus tanneri]|uniref:Uncharacterized protein n=1 Tax=Aspergillus tanneri TaxID=1220188 RepID=A0A5M9MTV5_9EURO|nr:uncharacterized protein ATNIH1004_003912 [Aspergillus tanneri]KAA8648029.1 hypothetical protein ATNIH1004_003912 [Aspergillus tanneri]
MAAQGGHITTLRALLSKKQPDQACSPAQLRTVLHWAIRTHNSELLELMIKHEAPLDPAGDSQEALSALGVAVSSRYNFIIPRLLKIGARSGYGEYPCPIEQAICTDQPQLVELFLKHGMRLNGDNGLCYIAQQGDKYLLQLLLDYGLDLDLYGNAALFTAIMEGQYEMTEFLINNGSNPHLLCELWRRDKLCFIGAPTYSSIEFAIHFQHLDILKLLLEKGVLPRQKEFDLAVKEYKEAVALLSKFPKDSSRRKLIEVYVIFAGQKRWEKDPNFKMPFTSAGVWDSTSTSSTSELTTINGEPVWLE